MTSLKCRTYLYLNECFAKQFQSFEKDGKENDVKWMALVAFSLNHQLQTCTVNTSDG